MAGHPVMASSPNPWNGQVLCYFLAAVLFITIYAIGALNQ